MLNADERNERWLKVSIGLLRFEEHMMHLSMCRVYSPLVAYRL